MARPLAAERGSAPTSGSHREHSVDRSSAGKRRDIQGLRMVAVVAVVVNHLTGHPRGGFVGVDVFFVISGYLITAHLVRDLSRTSGVRQYVGDFYRRRVRRLMPAALLVIAATLAVSRTVLDTVRFDGARRDGIWAAAFGANWHLIDVKTDYFTAGGPESPFQHYWSLSVEEQFYLVWPLALLLLGRLAARHRWAVVGGAAAVLGVASLLLAVGPSMSDPTVAYFSTITRAWELALGALVACLAPSLRASIAALTALSFAGLTLVGISLFTAHGGAGFPVPGAVLPCLGSALVLAAASGPARARNVLLTNRGAVFLGDISYSIYLVHFPVIVLLSAEMPYRSGYFYATALALMFGLSVLLYSAVEKPVLDSRWLLPGRDRARPRPRPHGRHRGRDLAFAPAGRPLLVGVLASAIGVGIFAAWPGDQAAVQAQVHRITSGPSTPTDAAGAHQRTLSRQIDAALRATSWPSLSPAPDDVLTSDVVPAQLSDCGSVDLGRPQDCTFGSRSATRTAYLIGDSTSVTYDRAFLTLAGQLPGWRFRAAGAIGCAFTATVLTTAGHLPAGCAEHNDALIAEIKRTKPDLVIVTDSYISRSSAPGHRLTERQYAGALRAEIAKISPSVKRIGFLAPTPYSVVLAQCYSHHRSPVDCVSRVPAQWVQRSRSERALSRAVGGVFVDSRPWFCNAAGYCPAFVGRTVTRRDYEHVTQPYATAIAPAMLEAFRAARLFA